MQQNKQYQRWQMKGTIYTYDMQNKSVAFTNNIESNKVIIYIGGLGDTLLSTPFTSQLCDFCNNHLFKLIIPQFRSMPNYRLFTMRDDVYDLHKIILQNKNKNIILLGHSSGCQVSMIYLTTFGSQNIHKVILQAPVSDVQYQQSKNPNLIKQLKQAHNTQFFKPSSDHKIWLSQRFMRLYQRFNQQDWFSIHLPDQNYKKWKQFNIPIISIVCGNDQYVKFDNLNKLRLGSQVFVIQGASHSMKEKKSREQFFKILSEQI